MFTPTSFSYSLGLFQLLALALGIYSPSYFPTLIPLYLLFCIFFIASYCFYQKYYLFFSLLIGLSYGGIYAHWVIEQQWPLEPNNQKWLIKGVVSGLPQQVGSTQRFHLNLTSVESDGENLGVKIVNRLNNKKIALSWRNREEGSKQNQKVRAGDYWQFEVKLRRPRGFVNPAGFDYQLYLLQQGIKANGYVRNSAKNKKLDNVCYIGHIHCWRESLRQKISDKVGQNQYVGLVLGLLIGDKQSISAPHWDTLKNTGTIHLLAISGLHIGLAALIGLLCGQLLMKLYQLMPYAKFDMRSRCLPSFFSILFAFFYSCLAGLSVPTQRALVMIVLFHVVRLFYRSVSPWQLLFSALVLVGIFDPLSIRSHGFYFSFLAVAILLFTFFQYQQDRNTIDSWFLLSFKSGLFKLLKAQLVLAIALFVPSVLLVQGVSLSSPVANLLAVPLVSLLTVPLLLVALIFLPLLPVLSQNIFLLAEKSLQVLFLYLEWVQNNIGHFWHFDFGTWNIFAIVIATLGIFYLLLPRGFPAKYLSIICFAPIFYPDRTQPPLTLLFLDVGQGTAIIIETPKHQLVFDTGKHFSERFDSGEHIIAPYLLRSGHREIDLLITSHGDSDHAGGMDGLSSLININKHYSGEPNKTGGHQCIAGHRWHWDDIEFSVLWPAQHFITHSGHQLNSNNTSCVVLIEYAQYRFLLTGDVERAVEKQLLNLYPVKLSNLTAVLVPHHGSRSSSHLQWVDHLQAKYAIVTAGYSNAYRHPHPQVIGRYQNQGAAIHNTGKHGAIRITVDSVSDLTVSRWREYHKRYWYD